MIKYILKNITSFIKKEHFLFVLVVLSIFCSIIMVLFVFGFFHHIEQEKLDAEYGENELVISFNKYPGQVTKGDMMDVVLDLDENTLDNCYIDFNGHFQNEHSDDIAIDHSMLMVSMSFSVIDGRITVAPTVGKQLKDNGVLKDGVYFTAQQVEKGEYVCIAPSWNNGEEILDDEAVFWAEKYSVSKNGNYIIDGKEYKCIGHADWVTVIPVVPVTTVTDDCYLQEVVFTFYNPIKKVEYENISKTIRDKYGEIADIPDINIVEDNSIKFYNSLLMLCIALALISGIIVSFLYQYIILQRAYIYTVYRMCGMTRTYVKIMSFFECLIVSLIVCISGTVIFDLFILPYMSRFFEYMYLSYTVYTYLIMNLVYIAVTSIVLFISINMYIKKSIITGLGAM